MSKKPWLSKTIWTNIILAVVAFIPPVQSFLAANPDTIVYVFVVINLLLRLITKGKIVLKE